MNVYDTLSGRKRAFEPLAPGQVRMYVCGITPYAPAHVGHAMSAIVFDVVRRYLEHSGYAVTHVQNFTDVDDKLIVRAAEESVGVEELAERHIADYLAQLRALNVLPAHEYPRATQQIPKMVEIINGLIDRGYAYATERDVYFRVTRAPRYGELSHRSLDTMRANARLEANVDKEHPMDFALWKGAKPGEPAWASPWGQGRPGWHIECSAMALGFLGEMLDIHGGGQDLVFPHHENEIAQSEAFNGGAPLAQFWMHNGMMFFESEKMSKSLGNFVTIAEALERRSPDALRHLVLSSHYRSPATYSEELLEGSERAMARLRQALAAESGEGEALDPAPHQARFIAAMDDDFGTPQALAALFDLARDVNRGADQGRFVADAQRVLRDLGGAVLGLQFEEREAEVAADLSPRIQSLVDRRAELRAAKRFADADAVRDELAQMGIELTDSPTGTTWRMG